MKLIKHLLLATALCVAGCGDSKVEPKSPVNPIDEPTVPHRSDLPMNWFEVSRDNWSYGLPFGFDAVKLNPQFGILSQHHSAARQIDVSFTTHQTDADDLRQYVISNFIMPSMIQGKTVIATAESDKNPAQIVLAVQLIYPVARVSDKISTLYESSLDFFVLKEKTVYHMSCFGEASALKKNSDVCFKVIDSLLIK
jgi:hypothetical protein